MTEPNRDPGLYSGDRPPPTPAAREIPADEAAPLPRLGRLGGDGSNGPQLQSLAQSARGNQLGQARGILIFVGIITLLLAIFFIVTARAQLMEELRKQGLNEIPPQAWPDVLVGYAILGGLALLGVVFIILGVLVRRFPIPCTVTGLVLYLAANLADLVLDPATVARGIIIKIIIVVALVKAVQAAFAYERERREQAEIA